jgi:paraquat-inducible protein B
MNRVARQAETTLGGFDEDSRFSASTRETLREIKQAAEAVSSLARAIERRPNSLLTGR